MDKFIEISLTEIGKNYEKLLNNKISIILGSPGSGKTCLAKHLAEEFKGHFFTISNFMEYFEINEIEEIIKAQDSNPVLILDGFDEYRIFEKSKIDTSKKLSIRIKKIIEKVDSLKIIITCRELDWYGDNDKETLEKFLDLNVKVYYIKPLSDAQIKEFAKMYEVSNIENFISKFKSGGFLSTPQLLKISVELANKNINNKIELYEEFIKKAILEANNYHKEVLNINKMSNEALFENLGYMAFFYIFAKIESFEEEILREIAKEEFEYKILEELVSNLKLFKNKVFIHRTFAEYLAAYFIYNYLMKKRKIAKEIIKGLFLNDNFVYTEFRGTYAWFCSISQLEYFIDFDPFYQLLYGENNHFGIEFKKKILLSIKRYSVEINPYFINPNDFYLRGLLNGFYDKEMDDFIIQEIEEAIKMKNHYLNVFELIISNNRVSEKLKKFLFEKLKDNSLGEGFKVSVIKSQNFEVNKLKEVLNQLIENKIKDEDNRIKIAILNKIYPENIEIKETVEVIKTFKETSFINICKFLYKTPKEKQIELIELLEKEIMMPNRNNYPYKFFCIKNFLSDFYYKLIKGYNGKNARNIFNTLKRVRQYYESCQSIEIEPFKSKVKKLSDKKLAKLANELFKFYLEDILKERKENFVSEVIHFKHFFPLKIPTNVVDLCIKKMEEADNQNLKEELFKIALIFSDAKNIKELENLAKKYKMEEIFENDKKQFSFSIPKEKMTRIENRKKEELKKELEKNEKYLKKMNKNDFLKDFKALNFISEIIYFNRKVENYISMKTFKRLKNYLKDLIFTNYYDEQINLKKIFSELNNIRYVDSAFLSSLYLNENNIKNVLKLSDKKLKYLYFLAITHEKISSGITNKTFIEKFEVEKKDLAIKTLLEWIEVISGKLYEVLKEYFENSEIFEMKEFFNTFRVSNVESNGEENKEEHFIDAFLFVYNFKVNKETLINLKKDYNSELLNIFYKFRCRKENLSVKELVKLYVSIFEYKTPSKVFNLLSEEEKIRLVLNFLKEFDSEDKMPFHNGFQSNLDLTINFVKYHLINLLSLDELKKLDNKDISEYWNKIIKKTIAEKSRKNFDFTIWEIKNLKQFIFEDLPMNEYQFFKKVEIELDELIKRIERNENNEKDLFWEGEKNKKEEKCRDALVNIWKSDDNFIRESQIGNFRADIEVVMKNRNWKVRIECKLDENRELLKSLNEQLINKYLNNREANYGIYLVFYFGNRNESKDELEENLKQKIPPKWKNKVSVKLLDLRRN